MKNQIKLLIPSVLMFSVLNVNAETYRYKFKVASSGIDMYACNAGVLSQATQLVCVDKKTLKTYVGDAAKTYAESCATAKTNCNSSIICNQPEGSTFVNAMTGQVMSYADYSTGSRTFSDKVAQVSQFNKWSTLTSETDAKNTALGDLSFMFMTEMYNAKYFVDICIRAPQNAMIKTVGNDFAISLRAADVPLTYTKKAIPGQTNRDGVIIDESLTNYIKKAGVKVDGYVGCEVDNTGSVALDAGNVEFSYGADGITPVGVVGNKFFSPSTTTNYMNGTELLIQSTSVLNPVFCKVRYVFTETSLSTFRPNKLEGAEMCTYTEFNDPLNTSN